MGHYMGRHWSSLLDPTHVLDNPTQHFPNKQDPTLARRTRTQRRCQSDRGHRQVFSVFFNFVKYKTDNVAKRATDTA